MKLVASPMFACGVVALAGGVTAISIDAKPGGTFRGTAINQVVNGTPLPTTPLKFRLPNGKGPIRGSVFYTRSVPAATGDAPITGKIRKAASRQGGKRYVLSGKWTWNFTPTGAGVGPLSGPVRFSIKRTRRSYKLKPITNLKIGRGPPPVRMTGKVKAEK